VAAYFDYAKIFQSVSIPCRSGIYRSVDVAAGLGAIGQFARRAFQPLGVNQERAVDGLFAVASWENTQVLLVDMGAIVAATGHEMDASDLS
jgi:hypothetical protein